ncbi:hypothetical protein J6590_003656 [Homalodisca vitripennis]|nr:hypothetical protein J6590_003656 [Homalodisca vitripennis]
MVSLEVHIGDLKGVMANTHSTGNSHNQVEFSNKSVCELINVIEADMNDLMDEFSHDQTVGFAHCISADLCDDKQMSAGVALVFRDRFGKPTQSHCLNDFLTYQTTRFGASVYGLKASNACVKIVTTDEASAGKLRNGLMHSDFVAKLKCEISLHLTQTTTKDSNALNASISNDVLEVNVADTTLQDTFRNISSVDNSLIHLKLAKHHSQNYAKENPISKDHFFNEKIPFYMKKLDAHIKKNNGYLANGKLSWADLYFGAMIEHMTDIHGSDITVGYPNIKVLKERVFTLPQIKAWLDKRPEDSYKWLLFINFFKKETVNKYLNFFKKGTVNK